MMRPNVAHQPLAEPVGWMGVFGRSLRFAFRFEDMADRLHDSPKRWAIQGPPWTGGRIDLLFVDGEDVFALRHAVHCETKLSRLEQNTVRQLAAHGEPGGRAVPPARSVHGSIPRGTR